MIILNALCSFGLFVYSGSTNSLGNINIYSKTGSLCRRKNLYYHFLLVLVFHSFVLGVYFLVFH